MMEIDVSSPVNRDGRSTILDRVKSIEEIMSLLFRDPLLVRIERDRTWDAFIEQARRCESLTHDDREWDKLDDMHHAIGRVEGAPYHCPDSHANRIWFDHLIERQRRHQESLAATDDIDDDTEDLGDQIITMIEARRAFDVHMKTPEERR